MNRDEAIKHIEALYPPDSGYPETAKQGREIIEQCKQRFYSWRNEPTEVLVMAAQTMIEMESH